MQTPAHFSRLCEASRFHHAVIVPTDAASANCSNALLVDRLPKWTTFMGYPTLARGPNRLLAGRP
eukprot:11174192-Lingulodinium_polyedra.AAC.1